ncbi:MAG TPA: alpha/beta hydrolase [Devosiaceae bacterium]|nr:alpha/beta hydrolase [Devosiaceae bacterium]
MPKSSPTTPQGTPKKGIWCDDERVQQGVIKVTFVMVLDQVMPVGRGTVAVEGGEIAYAIAGNGPPIVFAHGIGGNLNSWWQQMRDLPESYTCISFSHRGFEASSDVTGGPRPEWFGQDLLALLDHLEIDRTAIVAQSMGGWTAMEFALLQPERVDALVLSGTTGSLRLPGIASLADSAADPEVVRCRADGINPAAGRRMFDEQPDLYRMFVEIDRMSGTWDRAPVRQALDRMRLRAPQDFAIACPILAIVGDEDRVCPPGNVITMAASLPRVEVLVVPAAGHSVYFEKAAAYNEAICDYLSGIETYS